MIAIVIILLALILLCVSAIAVHLAADRQRILAEARYRKYVKSMEHHLR
jgi:uncharacterized membrane protein